MYILGGDSMKKNKVKEVMLEEQKEVEEEIRKYSELDLDALYEEFHTSKDGISKSQLIDLEEEHDKNIITIGRKNTKFTRLLKALINPFNVILMFIAAVTFLLDVVLENNPADRDYVTVIIIVALVLISSAVSFIQGEKSNEATEQLTKLISNKADVLRDGVLTEILMEDILPGDVVRLSAGDMIPADVRFIQTKDTFVAQSALTGESNPVEKFSKKRSEKLESITDLDNIGFMGSNIVSGVSYAVVILTGNDTYFGSMAEQLSSPRDRNSFEIGVANVSKVLVYMMLVMVPLVFLINWFGDKQGVGWE